MDSAMSSPFVAVDVGNSRIKLGLFDRASRGPLAEPARVLTLDAHSTNLAPLGEWLCDRPYRPLDWWIASVHRAAAARLTEWIRLRDSAGRVVMLSAADLPLTIEVDRPDLVGVDRLVDAIAANALRPAGRPAVVVDVGSAITVDLVSAAGAFRGGAILPGIGMSARAMHEFTDLLPLIDMATLDSPPDACGTSTIAAMTSGLFWGAVGAIRELAGRLGDGGPKPQLVLTGGAGPSVARLIAVDALFVPHLTLSGIALVARSKV